MRQKLVSNLEKEVSKIEGIKTFFIKRCAPKLLFSFEIEKDDTVRSVRFGLGLKCPSTFRNLRFNLRGVSSVPFPFRFPFQLHYKLVSSLLALDATELVTQPLTQTVVEMINIHVISVQQKR